MLRVDWELFISFHGTSNIVAKIVDLLDHFTFLGDCSPTAPLSQHFACSHKLIWCFELSWVELNFESPKVYLLIFAPYGKVADVAVTIPCYKTLSRLFHLFQFDKQWRIFLELNSKVLQEKKRKLLFCVHVLHKTRWKQDFTQACNDRKEYCFLAVLIIIIIIIIIVSISTQDKKYISYVTIFEEKYIYLSYLQ